MQFWNNFAAKHPAAAKWVREGGLFVVVSNLITVFKYLLLQFLPKAFASLPVVDFGWPGIPVTLFGETFQWNILGYDAAHGGLPYFCAYMIAMVIGECINFPIQRNFVFRSKGNLAKQIGWYVVAVCLITCIVNSINCVWVAVAGLLVPDFIYNIGTTVLNGGISMVIFFFVNKIIFPEGQQKKDEAHYKSTGRPDKAAGILFVWALFAELEKCARKFGAQRVELMVWSHNAIAQKAYAAYGMTLQRSIDEIAL